jgi:putative sigma-54 modulation protein
LELPILLTVTLIGDRMKLIIRSHHLEVTPGIKKHLEEKLHLIKKHFDQIIQINAGLGVEKAHEKELRQTAELSLHLMGKDLFAIAHHADLYQAIDLAVAKLDKQIIKVKEKVKNHHHPVTLKHISADSSGLNL